MNCSTPGLPVHHQLLESTQTHVHWVGDAIQSSHPLSSPSPLTFNLSQHQGLFKWISSSYQVAKILEFLLQYQSFQWTPRTYPSPRISQFSKDSIFLLLENGMRNKNLVELIATGVPLLLGSLSRKSWGTYRCLLTCIYILHISIITSAISPSVSVLDWNWVHADASNSKPTSLALSIPYPSFSLSSNSKREKPVPPFATALLNCSFLAHMESGFIVVNPQLCAKHLYQPEYELFTEVALVYNIIFISNAQHLKYIEKIHWKNTFSIFYRLHFT